MKGLILFSCAAFCALAGCDSDPHANVASRSVTPGTDLAGPDETLDRTSGLQILPGTYGATTREHGMVRKIEYTGPRTCDVYQLSPLNSMTDFFQGRCVSADGGVEFDNGGGVILYFKAVPITRADGTQDVGLEQTRNGRKVLLIRIRPRANEAGVAVKEQRPIVEPGNIGGNTEPLAELGVEP